VQLEAMEQRLQQRVETKPPLRSQIDGDCPSPDHSGRNSQTQSTRKPSRNVPGEGSAAGGSEPHPQGGADLDDLEVLIASCDGYKQYVDVCVRLPPPYDFLRS
jgi:hypothetical protein